MRTQTVTPPQYARWVAICNDIGEHFAKDPSTTKMHAWLAMCRRELVDEIETDHELVRNLDLIDRLLDTIEARRQAVILLDKKNKGLQRECWWLANRTSYSAEEMRDVLEKRFDYIKKPRRRVLIEKMVSEAIRIRGPEES
jgi:hypothetical protein